MSTRIAPADLIWLLMDRPNNLMHVHSLVGFDRLPEFERLQSTFMDRMVGKYRVLSQVPVLRDGTWFWEDDNDFAIERHVRRVALTDDSEETLRGHVAALFSTPLPREHPLWEVQVLSGPDEEGPGFVVTRFHHGLGDGIRLVQLLLGLCDPIEGATPTRVGRGQDGDHHPLERVLHIAETTLTDTIDYVQGAGRALLRAGRLFRATTNPLELVDHLDDAVDEAIDLARDPVRLVDALTSVSSLDNQVFNSWREIARMLLADEHRTGAWAGRPGVDKAVSWIEDYPIEGLRSRARSMNATLNDMLLSAVSLGLTDYLGERGVTEIRDLSWLMPVSLRPIDGSLPPTLGNHFAVVQLSMPFGIEDLRALVTEVRRRTLRLKHSVEPVVAYGVQRVIAEVPTPVGRSLTNYFAGKTVGQLSNVPGPRVKVSLAGAPVRSILGWVPTSGDQPLGICMFSYDGKVSVGVATDARMIPDPERLTELVRARLDHVAASVVEEA